MRSSASLALFRENRSSFWFAAVFLTVLYLICLWPQNSGLKHLDSFEFLAQAEQLGISHPPGYSLFNLLGYTFILTGDWLGFSSEWSLLLGLYSLTYFSLLGLSWIVFKETGSALVSLFFGILLLQCRVFQFASNTIEVYGLVAFLFTFFLISIQWQQIPWCQYLLGGLLIAHHTTAAPVVLLMLCLHRPRYSDSFRWSLWIFVGPIVHCIYLSVRANSPLNYWFDFTHPYEHFYHFSAKLYSVFLGFPDRVSLFHNIEAISDNFPLWAWLLISLIGLIIRSSKNELKINSSNINLVGWMPEMRLLVCAVFLEIARNLCYHIPDIYSHTMILSILLLMIVARIMAALESKMQFALLVLSILGVVLMPKIYDRVDETVDLQKLVLQDAEFIFGANPNSVFVSNAVSMFPMYSLISKNIELASRLIPDWAFVEKSSYERIRRRAAPLDMAFEPFPAVQENLNRHSFFKNFLHNNMKSSQTIYLAALYASEPRLGAGSLNLNYVNRGLWNELSSSSEKDSWVNPIFLVISGYTDELQRFQLSRFFNSEQKPVVSVYLKKSVKRLLNMQLQWSSETRTRLVSLIDQPTHFGLEELPEGFTGKIMVRFLDLEGNRVLSETQIEKHL